MNANLNTDDLDYYLTSLEEYRLKFAKEKNYNDAEVTQAKIKEIKSVIEAKNKKEVEDNQINEIKGLESLFNIEIESFNKEQDIALRAFEENAKKLDDQLKKRQISEMDTLYKDFEEKYKTMTKKYSKEVLELRRSEEYLVKQQRYKEAKQIYAKLEVLIKAEDERLNKEKDEFMKAKIDKLIQWHQTERANLKKKLDLELNMLKRTRETGLDVINHKYRNKKMNLENQQKNEKNLISNNNLQRAVTSSNLLIKSITESTIKQRMMESKSAKKPKQYGVTSKNNNIFAPPKTAGGMSKSYNTEKFNLKDLKNDAFLNKIGNGKSILDK